jgi:energy-coupling factor transporter ATP-binding protein EcfA2
VKTKDFVRRRKGKPLLLVVGKSGSGKSYVLKSLGISQVRSHTTRPRRKGEDDSTHVFHDNDYDYAASSDVVATTVFNGYRYWACTGDLVGVDAYVIDWTGVRYLSQVFGDDFRGVFKIVLFQTSVWTRALRMRGRGDSWLKVMSRLWHDHWAFKPSKYKGLRVDAIIKS